MRRIGPLLWLALLLAACSGPPATPLTIELIHSTPTSVFDDPVLQQGERIYQRYCAHCHGYEGEGQIVDSVEHTLALGYHLVPPHDATGHTWQHPDALLVRVIREGVENPLHLYPMVGYEGRLTDEEIASIVAYMKLWWTDEQRAYQEQLNANWEAARAGEG